MASALLFGLARSTMPGLTVRRRELFVLNYERPRPGQRIISPERFAELLAAGKLRLLGRSDAEALLRRPLTGPMVGRMRARAVAIGWRAS